jgi:hypothetical protein
MTKTGSSPLRRFRPLPGTGRLGIVSVYFGLYGLAAAAATVGIGAAILIPALGRHITPSNPAATLTGAGLLTFGFLRTYRLLQQRRRSGALLAALCLAGSIVSGLASTKHDWTAFALPMLGLALLASVWQYLE